MAYPRFQRARAHKFATRTAGNVAVTSTTFAVVDSALDIALEAQAGDVLEFQMNAAVDNGSVNFEMDVGLMNGGTQIRTVTGQTRGIGGWGAVASVSQYLGGAYYTTVQSGDIIGGLVTSRLLARIFSAGTRTIYASTSEWPLQFAAKNLGPSDPT